MYILLPCDDARSHVVGEREPLLPVNWWILHLHRRREDAEVDVDYIAARTDHLIQELLDIEGKITLCNENLQQCVCVRVCVCGKPHRPLVSGCV